MTRTDNTETHSHTHTHTHTYMHTRTHTWQWGQKTDWCCAGPRFWNEGLSGGLILNADLKTFHVRLYCEVDETLSQWLFMGRNIHMYIYICVCLLKWKQCLNCTNSNKCISWWELDAKGTVQLFWQAGLLPWSHGQLGHKKTHNVWVRARLLQWNTRVVFLLSDTNHPLRFTVSLLRTYVCFVTSVCIEAVWVETDLDGGNKGALSLDNLVLLLVKGVKGYRGLRHCTWF